MARLDKGRAVAEAIAAAAALAALAAAAAAPVAAAAAAAAAAPAAPAAAAGVPAAAVRQRDGPVPEAKQLLAEYRTRKAQVGQPRQVSRS